MDSLDSNKNEDKCDIVENDSSCNGHLALEVNVLVVCAEDDKFEQWVEVDSDCDHKHQDRRPPLDVVLVLVEQDRHEDSNVHHSQQYADDPSDSLCKHLVDVVDKVFAHFFGVRRWCCI